MICNYCRCPITETEKPVKVPREARVFFWQWHFHRRCLYIFQADIAVAVMEWEQQACVATG